MATEIPPWLHGSDIAGEYTRGLQIGASIGQEQQRLAVEENRTAMEAKAREQTFQRETAMEQQRIATDQAYKQSMAGLRKQQLDQAAQVNQFKTQEAVKKMADQKGFADDLAAGMPVDKALFRHPSLTSPAAAIAAHKSSLDSTQQRIDIARKNLELRERQIGDAEHKPDKIGTMDIPLPSDSKDFNQPILKGVPVDSPLINQVMGDRAPAGTGTNFMRRANGQVPIPAAAATAAPGAMPFKEGQLVRSKKTGKTYRIKNGEPVEVQEE